MQNVGQPFGVVAPERPVMSISIWRVVGDLSDRVYYFNSSLKLNKIWVKLDKLDFSKEAPIMKLNVADNSILAGDVTAKFVPAS